MTTTVLPELSLNRDWEFPPTFQTSITKLEHGSLNFK